MGTSHRPFELFISLFQARYSVTVVFPRENFFWSSCIVLPSKLPSDSPQRAGVFGLIRTIIMCEVKARYNSNSVVTSMMFGCRRLVERNSGA